MPTRLSSLLQAAASYDLATLADARSELSIPASDTSNDDFLSRAITQASSAIATYCGRIFPVERVTDTFYLADADFNYNISIAISPLQLSRWPAVAIVSVVEADVDLVEGTDFQVDYEAGQIFRLSRDNYRMVPWLKNKIVVTFDGGYGSRVLDEAKTVPATGPYTATVAGASLFFADLGVTLADGTELTKISGLPGDGEYAVATGGIYSFNAAQASAAVLISYSKSGSIPSDLGYATLRWVTMRFRGKDRDPLQISRSQPGIGEDRWWVGPGPGNSIPAEISGIIEAYRGEMMS